MVLKKLGGRYAVQDKIGAGGMATVYRGLDEVLGRTVAIKTMLPQYATDPSFAARFKQEAQAAAALQSPYIVSVYDWGKDEDTYYIVMEYLRGTDLKSGLRKHGALESKKVAQIGSQIAQALSVAHKHDIIHRDIKPQNIMVQPDGNIKVMDFGIARAKNSHLTQDNSVLGTAHYVSPEQTQGKDLGPTTDIYSLGVVMYEAATGQVPFQGDDAISVALKQVNELPVPPSQINPAIDPALESIILKCMEKDPANRFQSANELYRVLRDYLAGRITSIPTTTQVATITNTANLDSAAATMTSTRPIARAARQSATGQYRPQTATQQALEMEAGRRKRKIRNTVLGILASLAVIAAAIFFVTSVLGDREGQYPVPNYMYLSQEEAEQQIEADEHFTLGEVDENYSETVPEGHVMEQTPAPNRYFPEGTAIDLIISKGPTPAESVTAPDLLDKTASEVDEILRELKLIGRAGDEVYSDLPAGHVAEQDPAPGSAMKAGDTITYHLSKGTEQAIVPDVLNDTEEGAREALTAAGLEPEVSYASSNNVYAGRVISTYPGPGETVDRGSTVTITISTGPSTQDIPNVIGMDYESGMAALNDAGFYIDPVYEENDAAVGTIIGQAPTGSAVVGSTITITISTGPAAPNPPGDGGTPGG
ncbi:Stk1 family PASTA domain-containing Ser/Thr kinase [Coriobacteriales bacterium OH1046]|nr:Stk1 family PASTA domain-containing Ser/Thr kinase [Coriobacteriales bacterium OH1046]